MSRTLSVKNLYDKKHKTLDFKGIWGEVCGTPEPNGAWIIYGIDKHGKTTLALMMADYLSNYGTTLYISAEEGTGPDFVRACKKAGLPAGKRGLNFIEYEAISDLKARLKKRRAPRFVFIDNITFYREELKHGVLKDLLTDYPNTLFIFLAHEERNEPYTATAKMCRRFAKLIFHTVGLQCTVSGRCPGGVMMIDEEKALLYHGTLAEEEVKS